MDLQPRLSIDRGVGTYKFLTVSFIGIRVANSATLRVIPNTGHRQNKLPRTGKVVFDIIWEILWHLSQAVNLLDFYWRPETCLRPVQIVVCWASEMLANDQLITIALCTGWDAGQMSHCYRLLGSLNTHTVQHGHQGIHFFVQILIQ